VGSNPTCGFIMKMKISIPKILLTISLTIILLLWPVALLTSNPELLYAIQKKNTVHSTYFSPEQKESYTKQIIYFFNDDIKDLSFLSSGEMSHMQDVKNILTKVDIIFWSSLVMFSLSIIYLRKSSKNILKNTSLSVLGILIIFLMLSVFTFNIIFQKFHDILFSGNYSFPFNSALKILYPDAFFRDIFILYFLLSILGCLVMFFIFFKLKVKKL
jgi:integral membrane protein (TIGR01906 family)